MGMVFSRQRTYGSHRGVWLDFDEIRRHADLVTVAGPRAVTCSSDLDEGSILHTMDGSWMEVFIVDPRREKFFCERILLPDVA